jgi:hypothetical protein
MNGEYLSGALLFLMFLIASTYALKTDSIRDYTLSLTSRTFGTNSRLFRLQARFMGNAAYVMSFRMVACVVAV